MGFKDSLISEMAEHFSTRNIFHEEIEISAVLGDSFEVDNERMVNLIQDPAFVDDVISLFGFNDLSLFHDLDTCAFLCFFVSDKFDFTKGA